MTRTRGVLLVAVGLAASCGRASPQTSGPHPPRATTTAATTTVASTTPSASATPATPAVRPVPPAAPALPRADAPTLPPGMSWIVAPAPELALTRVALSGRDVLGIEQHRVLRLVRDRWAPVERAAPPPADDDVRIAADGSLRRVSDGRVFSAPGFRPTRAWLANDLPVAAAGGRCAMWREHRMAEQHRDTGRGHGIFVEPGPPGWQRLVGAVPREVVGVIGGDPVRLVGRAGEVSAVSPGTDFDLAGAEVAVPRPAVVRLLPLHDGALLIVTETGLTHVWRDGPHTLTLAPDVTGALALEAARPAYSMRAPAAALDDGAAVLALGKMVLRVDATDVRGLDELPHEAIAVVAEGPTDAIVVTHVGRAYRVHGTVTTELVSSRPPLVHTYGAFRGSDGRVRILDSSSSMGCVEGGRLVACELARALDDARVHPLDDGLVVEDQHVETWLVSAAGAIPLPRPPFRDVSQADYAGSSIALVVLARGVWFRGPNDWSRVDLPETLIPQAIARAADGRALVGLEGGAVLAVGAHD